MSTFFTFTTELADVDETTPDQPYHPAIVLMVDLGAEFDKGEHLAFIHVIVPPDVVGSLRPQLRAGARVKVKGNVEDFEGAPVHVASSLELAASSTRH